MIYRIKIDIFVDGEDTKAVFEEAKQDRRLVRSKVNVFAGGLKAAPDYYQKATTPDVLIVEEVGNDKEMIEDLARLAEVCEPTTKVVIIGHLNDISLYRMLIQQGISEYLLYPINAAQVLETLDDILIDPDDPQTGKVIAFYGARGGVGSSTIAQNTAWLLSQMRNDEVALVDTDLAYGTSALSFNVDTRQTLVDALSQPKRLDSALLDRFMVKLDSGMMLLSAPAKLESNMPISIEAIEKVLDLSREMASCVIVDMPHRWSPWIERVLTDADETVIVATPDLSSFRDVKSIVDTIGKKRGEDAPLTILFNFVDAYRKTQLSTKDFQETLGIKPKASIPFDPALFGVASNNGQMLDQVNKSHKVVEILQDFACKISGWENAVKKQQSDETLMEKFNAWLKS